MNLLAIFQAMHRETKQSGAAPSSVAGLSGKNADLLAWAIEAHNEIQRDKDGRWKWLRRAFTLNTVADTMTYTYGDATDDDAAAAIARFRAWDVLDVRDPPHIYLVSDGESTETRMQAAEWPAFRHLYLRGTHESGAPGHIAVDHLDNLYVGPTPSGIYRISGYFWRSNLVLADDDDEPEMPSDYHMAIVWQGILKYGFNEVAAEVLAKAQTFGPPLYQALTENQGYDRFSMTFGDALA